MEKKMRLEVTRREHATILAGLRAWQATMDTEEDAYCDCDDRSWRGEGHDSACEVTHRELLRGIASDSGELRPLSAKQIDSLVARINA